MQHDPPSPRLSNADLAAILADLQANVDGTTSLRHWIDETHLPIERVVAGDDLTYVRLGARDGDGSQVVLMLLEGVWERAI